MRFFILTFILAIIISGSGQSQNLKYEFRAVWVATVTNIDWPSQPGLSVTQQQEEAIDILNLHKQLGMNAIILQVRPSADAFYSSSLEPWSRYLTGIPGKMPEPFYDPLLFWIEECHKRGMELHAWLNPYRVALNQKQPLAGNHIAFKHPEWIIRYGNSLYFDPGLPRVREFVIKVVKDIVSRYDVDGIHFDDYFYPYPLKEDFPDTTSFNHYSRGFQSVSKDDWRRENVDIIIKMLNDTIKAIKPWVKFGISPFGVWRNKADDPQGSDTRAGITNFDNLYANIIKWQKNGWTDYIVPQVYWHIGHPAADFKTLVNWWKDHSYNRSVYIGHAVYKSDKKSSVRQWRLPQELPRQINLVRQMPGLQGSAFYSSKHFLRDLHGFQDTLYSNLYRRPSLVPPMPWLDNQPPPPVEKTGKWGRKVKWRVNSSGNELDKANKFILYINEEGIPFDQDNPEFIYQILGKNEDKYKFQKINRKRKKYEVRISVIDRLNNESKISDSVIIKL
jgi:uncharacterized lipoprotein YddW (UPF0748 family)